MIVPYDPAWRRRAIVLIDVLRVSLGPTARRIDHIGSTAIPGMAAKAVFDLQVSVPDLNAAADAFDAPLISLDFQRLPYEHDHVPAGRAESLGAWEKRFWIRRGPEVDVNLHVRRAGSPNERVALLFRDWFRAHPAAVAAYSSFKRSLAEAVPDADAYTDLKDPIVDLVLAAAEPWAQANRWSP